MNSRLTDRLPAHFNAELGGWKRPLRATPGNLTLSQRGKIWIGIIAWCAMTFGTLVWIAASLFSGGAQ